MPDRLGDRVWPYDSASRRRARSLWRVATAAARSRSMEPMILPAYWWNGHPNFGDALTPWILARYGVVAVHTPPDRARASGVGSIVEQLQSDFSGTIWGSGLLHGDPLELPQARVLAVRGPLTKAALGIEEDVALGDPGLLVGRWASRGRARWRIGIVPHGVHREDPSLQDLVARRVRGATVVDVRRGPGAVIRHISHCSAVLTTSLHGLVVADALGIPAAWTQRHPPLWGGDFKFRDYEAVVTPGRSREIRTDGVLSSTDLLAAMALPDTEAREESIARVEETIRDLPVSRESVWRVQAMRRGHR
ncbi:Polysaccharide pyruvyl transferase [Janibacter indicus]|uniref:Polysaccharide pyruvyl transferase n=2 Tax=Janibacter indicus TaxID=857417 RepID=A0A1W1ZQ65_9MICO|nr:Polysaccharide pyruvyl transferase [Janibacter indicus]